MPSDKFMATWKGPARETQDEAVQDISRLNEVLKRYAPSLYADTVNLGEAKRIPGWEAVNAVAKS